MLSEQDLDRLERLRTLAQRLERTEDGDRRDTLLRAVRERIVALETGEQSAGPLDGASEPPSELAPDDLGDEEMRRVAIELERALRS